MRVEHSDPKDLYEPASVIQNISLNITDRFLVSNVPMKIKLTEHFIVFKIFTRWWGFFDLFRNFVASYSNLHTLGTETKLMKKSGLTFLASVHWHCEELFATLHYVDRKPTVLFIFVIWNLMTPIRLPWH